MKIGLVCPYSVARGGGVQEIVFAMQTELRRRGHDVIIITPQPRGYSEEDAKRKHLIYLGNSADFNSPLHTVIQVSASLNAEIDEMLAREKFDILHFHEPWVPFLSRQILARSKAVNVATFHATLPNTPMSRTVIKAVTPYTKSIIKYIDEFTAVTESAAEYVCTMTDASVAIIPPGIDLKKYQPPVRRSDSKPEKTIFYVGRLENRKGVKCLVDAFKVLNDKRPEVSLIIAGDGPDRSKLESQVAELELGHKISFKGYISDEDKIKYLHESDLFCAPALYGESFGVVLLEAMATGLVTVAGNNVGYSSVMRGMGAISLVSPKDTEEFARRLDLLLHEPSLRRLWRNWAKDELPQYDYSRIVDQYEEVYEQAYAAHFERKKRLLRLPGRRNKFAKKKKKIASRKSA
jgi:phosphatidylinositol alpha-mannosyltransferase